MLYFEQYIIGTVDVVNMSSVYQYLIVLEQGNYLTPVFIGY
jgi:hypothetical protein